MHHRYRPLPISREMDHLQHEMNRLFENSYPQWSRSAPSFPVMNVWADEESVLITAELPGLGSNDIELNVLNDTLALSGNRTVEELPENAVLHRQERSFGKFSRSTKLPYNIDPDKVEAKFNNGVLEVTLPRSEADRPKKISINVN